MTQWDVVFADEFEPEFDTFAKAVQDELLAHLLVLRDEGPNLGRPLVDTLKGSDHANMKELRFSIGKEVWRFAFAFDPKRTAVVLVGGDKAEKKRFYGKLIKTADRRFTAHLKKEAAEHKRKGKK